MIDINEISKGDRIRYRDGKIGQVFAIEAKVFDGALGWKEDVVVQARFMVHLEGGGGRYTTHRRDGVSHSEAASDIVGIRKMKMRRGGMTRQTYFIVKEPGMLPHVKRPSADPADCARELIAHYPAGTAIIHVSVQENDLWVDDAATFIAMDDGYKAMAEAQSAADAENNALLEKIKTDFGAIYTGHIEECLRESEAPADFTRLEIVEKPTGKAQAEDWGSFKKVYKVYVEQWSVGPEGDSFDGYLYIPLPDGKFLKAAFSI